MGYYVTVRGNYSGYENLSATDQQEVNAIFRKLVADYWFEDVDEYSCFKAEKWRDGEDREIKNLLSFFDPGSEVLYLGESGDRWRWIKLDSGIVVEEIGETVWRRVS